MATVSIARTAPKAKPAPKQPVAYLISNGIRLHFPFAPVETTLGGDADTWDTLERPGRMPLVRHKGSGLRTLAFDVLIGYTDNQAIVEGTLDALRRIANTGGRVYLGGMSYHEVGPWRMTDCQITATARQAGTNKITRATASLSFLHASDVTITARHTGPTTGGHKPTKPKPHPVNRYYTMRRGDTLSGVAHKFYGHAALWPRIARASGIRNTRTIKVGKRLTIPPL